MRLSVFLFSIIFSLNAIGQFKTLPYVQLGESENLDKMVLMWHTNEEVRDFKVKYHNTSGNCIRNS